MAKPMKTMIALNGSPRPDGNTGRMLREFAAAAARHGIAVKTVELRKMRPAMCLGCLSCFKTGRCVQDDGLNELMAEIEAADGIIAASPAYYASVTAQLKAVMDRIGLLGEAHGRSLRGKVGGSISVARRWGHLTVQAEIMLWFDRCEMNHVGCGWCSATSTDANDISGDAEGLGYPARLAENIARLWQLPPNAAPAD